MKRTLILLIAVLLSACAPAVDPCSKEGREAYLAEVDPLIEQFTVQNIEAQRTDTLDDLEDAIAALEATRDQFEELETPPCAEEYQDSQLKTWNLTIDYWKGELAGDRAAVTLYTQAQEEALHTRTLLNEVRFAP